MRAVLVLMSLALAGGFVAVSRLPEEAQAEPIPANVRAQEIRSVSFDGRGLPTAALRDVLGTRAGNLIDLATVQQDRIALVATLVGRGYLAAEVAEPRVTFGAGGAAFVTFPIQQGPLFRIRSVTVTGASDIEAGVLTLGLGEIADGERIALARKALEERLGVRGKQGAVEVRLVRDGDLVDVQLTAH